LLLRARACCAAPLLHSLDVCMALCLTHPFNQADVHPTNNPHQPTNQLATQGFGWAIAKALAEAGAEISLGVWVPALNIFETSFRRGKFDESRALASGGLMDFAHIYPMDAVFDTPEDVPEEVRANKRYAGADGFTISECAAKVAKDIGKIDILVHSLANGPEVTKPLLETSRKGYLAAMSASSYSYVSMLQRFGPLMNPVRVLGGFLGG
jgi:enoyl-[acyl-carrier protein] reductase I